MAGAEPKAVVAELMTRHGRTFAEDIGADVAADTAEAMFRLLVFATLASARIRVAAALEASNALFAEGWTNPGAMVDTTWEQRVDVLNHHGYARYDESTARILGESCQYLLDTYDGDVRGVRDAAEYQRDREHALLMQIKGIGPVGADIFLREAQAGWDELVPYVDARTRQTARDLGLPGDPRVLLALVERDQFPCLVAALTRSRLEHDADAVLDAAAHHHQ
jgi:endonuclease III